MSHVAPERFRHTPFVCGYLGRDRGGHWPSLVAAAPVPVVERSTGRRHGFAASQAPGLETVGPDPEPQGWCWGRHIVGSEVPRGWRDAAQEIGMAGLWAGRDEVRLHTDTFALHDVYVRELDGTTYFSNRVDPLAALGTGPLHVDWGAWGTQLIISGFLHDTTGFTEIRRLQAGASLVAGRRGAVHHQELPGWFLTDADDATMDEVVDVLLDEMPAPGSQESSALGLSGGFDSRLIAILLDRRGVRGPVTWSTDKDENRFIDDSTYGAQVAAALGLENHVVRHDGPRSWTRHREPSLLRLEHENALHTWLAPLAARVRRAGVPLWDGLLADVLLRSAGWQGVLAVGDRERQMDEQWRQWGGARVSHARVLDAVRPELTTRWYADGFASYLHWAEQFKGLPSELKMINMTLKSNRITGPSPLRLFGPDVPVRLPFVAPSVVKVLIRLSPERIVDERLYRDLLQRLNPVVAAIPSTNDKLPGVPGPGRVTQTHRKVKRLLTNQIAEDEVVLSLFTPTARDLLRAGAVDRVLTREALQWGQAMASWRARYAGRLVDDRP